MRFPHIEVKRIEGKKLLYWLPDKELIIIDPGKKLGNIYLYKLIKATHSCGLKYELERHLDGEELSMPNFLQVQEIKDNLPGLKTKILQNRLMAKGLWIETCSFIFPDFIVCDGGDKNFSRSPERIYISVKHIIDKLNNLSKTTQGSLWNAFVGLKFFDTVQTTLFKNESSFTVNFNNEKFPTSKFINLWEEKIQNLMDDQDKINSFAEIKNLLEEKIRSIEKTCNNSIEYWEELKKQIGFKDE